MYIYHPLPCTSLDPASQACQWNLFTPFPSCDGVGRARFGSLFRGRIIWSFWFLFFLSFLSFSFFFFFLSFSTLFSVFVWLVAVCMRVELWLLTRRLHEV
ncbi:hypothetical protein BDR22DRAFT_365505 [Usnea florida]